jgi:hypothetical protein
MTDRAGKLIQALLATRDPAFDPPPFDPAVAVELLGPAGGLLTPHRRLLELANGAYFHGHALHVFGACERPPWHGLRPWNAEASWRDAYGGAASGLTFFAEDAFGDQFAYRGDHYEVVLFEAELGRVVPFAPHFVAWLAEMVERPGAVLPMDLMDQQRAEHHGHQPGTHLFSWPPLAAAEAHEGVSVGHVDALEAMRFRGQLASRLRDLPAGSRVRLDLDPPGGAGGGSNE